jgi:hypothetical protein
VRHGGKELRLGTRQALETIVCLAQFVAVRSERMPLGCDHDDGEHHDDIRAKHRVKHVPDDSRRQ